MQRRTLALQPRAQQVEWVDHARTQRAAEAANRGGDEAARGSVLLVAPAQSRVARRNLRLEELKGAEVDGGVGEHARQSGREAAVEGAQAALRKHLACGGEDEGVAVLAAGHGFGLNAELERVDRVYATSGNVTSAAERRCKKG